MKLKKMDLVRVKSTGMMGEIERFSEAYSKPDYIIYRVVWVDFGSHVGAFKEEELELLGKFDGALYEKP